jgi:hypothetical protein
MSADSSTVIRLSPRPAKTGSAPNASARRAVARPMRPGPTTAKRLPASPSPSMNSTPKPHGRWARRNRSPSTMRRSSASVSAIANSAVVSVSTSGVFAITMPRRRAASRSMLSTPTP